MCAYVVNFNLMNFTFYLSVEAFLWGNKKEPPGRLFFKSTYQRELYLIKSSKVRAVEFVFSNTIRSTLA